MREGLSKKHLLISLLVALFPVQGWTQPTALEEGPRRSVPLLVVNTIADLKGIAVRPSGNEAMVLGYHSAHDGGGGTYSYNATSTAPNNGGTVISPAAGSGRWLLQTHGKSVSVKQFGAKCDGATDDTNAIQASITATGTSRIASSVLIPNATCVVANGSLTIDHDGVDIVGANRQNARLLFNNGSRDNIIYAGSSQINNFRLTNLTIDGAGKTGGVAVSAGANGITVFGLLIDNVIIDNAWNGILMGTINGASIRNTIVNATRRGASYGIKWYSPPTTISCCLDMSNVVVQASFSGADGFVWDGNTTTLTQQAVALLATRYGFRVLNSATSGSSFPRFLQSHGLQVDGASITALQIDAGYDLHFVDSDIANNSGAEGQGAGDRDTLVINADPGGGITRQIYLTGTNVFSSRERAAFINAAGVWIAGSRFGDTWKSCSSPPCGGDKPVVEFGPRAADVTMTGSFAGVLLGERQRSNTGVLMARGSQRMVIAHNSFHGVNAIGLKDDSGNLTNVTAPNIGHNGLPTLSRMSVTQSISAAGAVQRDATTLTTSINHVTTVGPGAGVILPSTILSGNGPISVYNAGANALRIYPMSGGQINAGGVDSPITLPVGQGTTIFCAAATHCYTSLNTTAAITFSGTTTFSGNVNSTNLLLSPTAPTIVSGFGSGPSVVANNGATAFAIKVGTGESASTGVIGLSAAANGWSCFANNVTTTSRDNFLTKQTASATATATLTNYNAAGSVTPWRAGDIIHVSCLAY